MHVMLKRTIAAFTMAALFLATACAGPDQAGNENQNADAPVTATLAGGSPTGMLFLVCSGVSECVGRSYPGSSITIVPGGVAANVIRISNGEVDAGMAHSAMLFAAADGLAPYDEVLDNTATIAGLYPSTYQIIMKEELGVSSFGEIIEKKMKVRISIDQPGSSTAVAFERLLTQYGVDRMEFEAWGGSILQKNQEDSASMLRDGLIDGYAMQTLCPARSIQENEVGNELVMLAIEPDIITGMIDDFGYAPTVIGKGVYGFMISDIDTFYTSTVLTVPADASEELAYKLARSLVENLDYLRQIHIGLSDLTPLSMTQDLGAPLHPGAEKYYREIGILD